MVMPFGIAHGWTHPSVPCPSASQCSYPHAEPPPQQFTCPRAGWISTLLLKWPLAQCNHPAQGLTAPAPAPTGGPPTTTGGGGVAPVFSVDPRELAPAPPAPEP